MTFFDPPKLPWWRRALTRIPLLGWLFRKRIKPFKKLSIPLMGKPLPKLDTSIIERDSVKEDR
jgi:hypothetical protein